MDPFRPASSPSSTPISASPPSWRASSAPGSSAPARRSPHRRTTIAGNHDRTPAAQLHHAAWPLISDWLRHRLRLCPPGSTRPGRPRRYAGGLHEVWPLATEGRIELVVVEDGYRVAARVDELQQLHPTEDVEAVDVIDDVVDDLIEHVLLQGGSAVIVPDGSLADHERIAATVRF
ncbi:MAG: hypothetical protein R2749_03395 [Acidimicrobiales bacterium]